MNNDDRCVLIISTAEVSITTKIAKKADELSRSMPVRLVLARCEEQAVEEGIAA